MCMTPPKSTANNEDEKLREEGQKLRRKLEWDHADDSCFTSPRILSAEPPPTEPEEKGPAN